MNEILLKKYSTPESCPIRHVLDRIGDKWSMLILLLLEESGTLRFNEIHKYIKTISQKMLSSTLKALEEDGLINRTVFPQIPPKVEYELTPRGKSLIPHLRNLVAWASTNMADIQNSRQNFAR